VRLTPRFPIYVRHDDITDSLKTLHPLGDRHDVAGRAVPDRGLVVVVGVLDDVNELFARELLRRRFSLYQRD
jgi:hypothetical protein